jgi:imidazolonepropionase-like amidohydrolase
LKAVTINSAEILGVDDQIGSVEKGKLADLILTDGDPLEARTSMKQMFIAGVRFLSHRAIHANTRSG